MSPSSTLSPSSTPRCKVATCRFLGVTRNGVGSAGWGSPRADLDWPSEGYADGPKRARDLPPGGDRRRGETGRVGGGSEQVGPAGDAVSWSPADWDGWGKASRLVAPTTARRELGPFGSIVAPGMPIKQYLRTCGLARRGIRGVLASAYRPGRGSFRGRRGPREGDCIRRVHCLCLST